MTTDTTARVSGTIIPLEWIHFPGDPQGYTWRARKLYGSTFYIHENKDGLFEWGDGVYGSLEAAKGKAQAWHDARILAAIQPDPEPVATRSCTELVAQLSAALEDAINAPKGVVPKSAEPFYDGFQGRVRMPDPDMGTPITPDPEPQPVASSVVRYKLEWLAGARPPAHPEPMKGSATFEIEQAAISFFDSQADDAKLLSLTRVETVTTIAGSLNVGNTDGHSPSSAGMVSVEAALFEARKDMQHVKERIVGDWPRNGTLEVLEASQKKLDAALRALAGERG